MPLSDKKAPAAAYVTLTSKNPALSVQALVDRDGAVVTGGYGGWTRVKRPRRQGLTVFSGRDSFTMKVDLIFDQFRSGTSLEPKLTALERMALPPAEYRDPPTVTIKGATVPHSDLTWVIDTIEWGTAERNPSGDRIRQYVTVTLMRYVAADTVQLTSAGQRARSGLGVANAGGTRLYTVKAGETLQGIAARELGKATRWKEITDQKGNEFRDPTSVKKGDQIRLPAK